MKNFIKFLPVMAITFAVIMSSCSGNSPSSPDPTPTPTITPVYVDDFEDGDYANYFTDNWLGGASGGSSVLHYYLIYSGPNKNGSYAMSLSATVQAAVNAGSYYYGNTSISTGPSAGAAALDITEYNYLKFSLALDGIANGSAYPVVEVWMNNGATASAFKQVIDTFDPVFKEYSMGLSSFTGSGGNLSEVYPSVKQVIVYVYVISTVQNDTADIQMYIDDIRFTK